MNNDACNLSDLHDAAPETAAAGEGGTQNAAAIQPPEGSEQTAVELLERVVAQIGGAPRNGQIEMTQRVSQAIANREHLLVQAGTGTGKSYGYLVPAMLHAVNTSERVIISTATLALQRQIMTQDAPLVAEKVQELTGRKPKVALLKGWNNYACLRKVTGGYPEDGAFLSRAEGEFGATATGAEVMRARDWAAQSETGDRDDLIPGVSEQVWRQISVPKNECIGDKCPLRATCFPDLARKNAMRADVVVTNHAMLGVEASANQVLPEADVFLIDEAHDLVARVTNQLSVSFQKYDLLSLARQMRRAGLDDADLDESADEFNAVMGQLGEKRLTELPPELTQAFVRLLGRTQQALTDIRELNARDEEIAVTKQILRSRMVEMQDLCQLVLGDAISSERLVAWISLSRDDVPAFNGAPLDVASDIANRVFIDRAVVLTSATLQLGGSFAQVARNVGFSFPDQPSWDAIDVGSPFNYAEQGILYLPRNLPAPGRDGHGQEQLAQMVELIQAADGGALCLFTSHAALDRAAQYLREQLSVPVLCQGDDPLPSLVAEFSADHAACLLGTLSLWQGVDVPGLTNRLVIIDRIPFPRPDEPLFAARADVVNRRGGNGFMEVSAAHAALLLAQGAGRLLRRITDIGVVAVLDSRIVTQRYGRYLLRSMPRLWMTEDIEIVKGALRRIAKQSD
ncbi:ATP-dependent DNA helicase [Arcanobacterium hippocoleae]|uniref:ATP-dependent DNA helicase n=1 Tax=Arcanobacterium hippocoleae TaxID=149017 RepID=UPI003340F644